MDLFNIYYMFPLWISFLSIISLIISIVERKIILRYVGIALSIVVGIFALYVISAQHLVPGAEVSQRIIEERMLQNPKPRDIETATLIPAYWMFIVSMVLAIAAIFLRKIKMRKMQFLLYFIALINILGFFFVSQAIQKL